jgi:hypothetical protein
MVKGTRALQKRTLGRSGLEVSAIGAAVDLTPDALREMAGAIARIEVHGARYPEHLMKMVGR